MVVAHQTSGCQASLKDKGDYSTICQEVLFLLLLVLPSSTVASPYTYGQIFLDTSRLLTCCVNRCTATLYRTTTICKYPNPATENCCFHVSTVPVYGLPFPNKVGNTFANKGLVHYCTHTSTWCQQNNCTFPALSHFRPQTCNILRVREYYSMALQETMEKNHCIQSESSLKNITAKITRTLNITTWYSRLNYLHIFAQQKHTHLKETINTTWILLLRENCLVLQQLWLHMSKTWSSELMRVSQGAMMEQQYQLYHKPSRNSRARARFSQDIYSIQYCYGAITPSTLILP